MKTIKLINKILEKNINKIKNLEANKDRATLLINMWLLEKNRNNIPFFINNEVWIWLNPFMFYKYIWELWLPKEIIFSHIEKILNIDYRDYWYDWCDFWLDTFLKWDLKKIKENFINIKQTNNENN